MIEALVFPEAFQKLEPILKAATPLLVKGRVAVEDVGTRLIVSDARVLDQVTDRARRASARAGGFESHGLGGARPARELFTAVRGDAEFPLSWFKTTAAKRRSNRPARCRPIASLWSACAKFAALIRSRWCND